MKKVLSSVLVIALLFTMVFPTSLFAQEKGDSQSSLNQESSSVNEAALAQIVPQPETVTGSALNETQTSGVIQTNAAETDLTVITTEGSADAVSFPDTNLFNALVANGVDKNGDSIITQGEMSAVQDLGLYYKDITNLTGIEYAVNMSRFSLWGNANLADLEPLRTMKNLRDLDLWMTNVSNIEPIKDLPLTYLSLEDTSVSDADKVSLVRFSDQTCSVGGSTDQEILPKGLCDSYTVGSSDESIAVVSLEKIDEHSNSKIRITGIKAGSATIGLMIGTAKKDFNVIVNAAPSDVITFKDANLFTALMEFGVDTNKDGVISKTELAVCKYLSLSNKDIKDITELGYATALSDLYLDNNAELRDIHGIKGLTALKTVYLEGTAVSDADRLSLVKLVDQTGLAGYGKTIEISPAGLANNFSVSSLNPEIAEATVTNSKNGFNPAKILMLCKKEGTATIKVSLGEASINFKVTIFPLPTEAIRFEDQNLSAALLKKGVDQNGDGYITADELQVMKEIDLSYQGLKSLKGLEAATGLEKIRLNDNAELKDFSSLRGVAGNLKNFYVDNTGISPADRLSFLKTDDQSILQGVPLSWDKPVGLFSSSAERSKIKLTFSNPDIAESVSAWGIDNYYINGKKPGTTQVIVEYEGASTSFNLTVKGVNPDQPVGEKAVELPVLNSQDQIALDGSDNLWDISGSEPEQIKIGVKTYGNLGAVVPSENNEPGFIRQWGVIVDSLNTLWLWDQSKRDQAPVEQVKNVTETVSEYVYRDNNTLYYYDNFGKALDASNNLWMMKNDGQTSAYLKVVDNVKMHNWIFALDNNNSLWQFYETKKEVLKEVADFDFVRPLKNTDAVVYALKTDHSLWYGKSESGEFIKIADDVASLVKGDGIRGFVKTDGTSWNYKSAGSSEVIQVSELYKKRLNYFAVKNDGSTWYVASPESPIKAMNSEIASTNYNWTSARYYLADTNHGLWKFDYKTGEEAIKISDDFKGFTGAMGYSSGGGVQISGEGTGYVNSAGAWLDFAGNPQAANATVYSIYNYHVKGDHVIYRTVNGAVIPLLNQIEGFAGVLGSGVYVTRTDGSLWLVTDSNPPTMVKSGSSTTEPGEGGFEAFLGKDGQGNYYEYSASDLNNSYLAYQINQALPSAKMYLQFLNSHCQVIGLKDKAKGYLDYNAAATASLLAQMKGQVFEINSYLASSDARQLTETITMVKIVDKSGNVL